MRIKKCNTAFTPSGMLEMGANLKARYCLPERPHSNSRLNLTGFTLIEMLVVVAVIAILVTIVLSVASRLDTQGRISRTQNTIALLNTALSEFHDYGYCYDGVFAAFTFPLDCNEFTSVSDVERTLEQACDITNVTIGSGTQDPNYSGCEALYFFLSRLPVCERIMSQIDNAMRTNLDESGVAITYTIDGDTTVHYPLFRFIDPWGRTLQYDYYDDENHNTVTQQMLDTRKTFPVITSAGPDGRFGTADDIKSR